MNAQQGCTPGQITQDKGYRSLDSSRALANLLLEPDRLQHPPLSGKVSAGDSSKCLGLSGSFHSSTVRILAISFTLCCASCNDYLLETMALTSVSVAVLSGSDPLCFTI